MGHNDKILEKHREIIDEIQKEWEDYPDVHNEHHKRKRQGIRCSQISAVIMFLIEKGIIK